ncbi:LOW QUALITY PROTEIN: protein SINE1 [Phoenix dactylifera]|uniref:LOW QUALITY PROTEIN: protein SINE1 n=1 Tax=Phoenix dactylifera TaxID=42345 RepID=A0A8B9AN88_PHODC|nr:LOW QUALITY PROTEIN: protein SINE1 [Phoenix dactylifera]
MGRSLSPLLRQELANLDKDADSRRSAMKALKSYAKDLDSKAIPHFLAEVSDTKGPGSSSGECTISLYEVLARVHGRNIVPQIGNIMSTIMRTLSSSGGSFPLHQACSKVVPAIARYGIDPSTPNDEKTRIISSLCKPLSDSLMGRQESTASGAALCLKALVESNNWRFALDDMVNDVCLKVAGALEEKVTQTNAHMGLVMALVKHNGLIAEAYARSLVRSGLQILSISAAESNSQKRLSAIQMVNFLMKCVDPRSISSELAKVVDVMEHCQNDRMPFVRGAAFEALQTAKMISGQKGSRHEIVSSPIPETNFRKRNDKSPFGTRGSGSHSEFASPESQTIDSCIKYEVFTDSPLSVGQSSCNFECGRRTNRRLWNNDGGGVDISLKDGFFIKACSESSDAKAELELSSKGNLGVTNKEQSEAFSGFIQGSATSTVTRDTTPSPQRSRPQLTIDDVKIYTTPRKLMRSLQNSANVSSGGPDQQHNQILASPCSGKVELNPMVSLNGDSHTHNLKSEVAEKRNNEKVMLLGKHTLTLNEELVPDGTESVSSTGDVTENSACKICREDYEDNFKVSVKTKKSLKYGIAAMGFTWSLFLILVAVILSALRTENDELFFDVVPT